MKMYNDQINRQQLATSMPLVQGRWILVRSQTVLPALTGIKVILDEDIELATYLLDNVLALKFVGIIRACYVHNV